MMSRKKVRVSKESKEEILNLFNDSVPILHIVEKFNVPYTSMRYNIISWIGLKRYNEQMKETKRLSAKSRVTNMMLNRIKKSQENLEEKDDNNNPN
jgi:hypothetical protein